MVKNFLLLILLVASGFNTKAQIGDASKIKERFDYVYPFTDGFAQVKKDGKYGIINLQGQEVITSRI